MEEKWTVTVGKRSVRVLLGPDLPSTEEVFLRLYGDVISDADAKTVRQAKLIAAAPELLAACKLMEKELRLRTQADDWTCGMELAAKAIEKAESS